jgi:tetratricopeptide (TPR) repeat protein
MLDLDIFMIIVNRFLWVLVFLGCFQLLSAQIVCSESDELYIHEWILEPQVDGSVEVRGETILGGSDRSYTFSFSEDCPVRNFRAWEAGTEEPIQVIQSEEEDEIQYKCVFDTTKKKGFNFVVEFTQLNKVKEKNGAYSLYWGRTHTHRASCKATVTLPKNHELLTTKYLDPKETFSSHDRCSIVFRQDVVEDETFRFEVAFSSKGLELVEDGESKFSSGQYQDAFSAYQEAVDFYSGFTTLYGKDTDEFLAELQNRMTECWEKAAEQKFEEALIAFNAGDYELAETLFKEIHYGYALMGLSIDDTSRADECQKYISICADLLEKQGQAESLMSEGITFVDQEQYSVAREKLEEALALYIELQDEEKIEECRQKIAESLMSEGITSVSQEQYETAKGIFEEALLVYTELQDEEKIQECEEQIAFCQRYLGIVGLFRKNVGIIGGVIIVVVIAGIVVYSIKRKEKEPS